MTSRTRRPAFTLVELLVVIALILVLATLSAIYIAPAFADNKNVLRGADRVVSTLLIARQRALRDQAPRGVRFAVDTSTGYAQNLLYVEQPDPYRGSSPNSTVTFSGTTASFSNDVNLVGAGAASGLVDDYTVQPGDWLQIAGPTNFQIAAITSPTTATLYRTFTALPLPVRYKIIRHARPIAGEEPVLLPQNVAVNIGMSSSVPSRTIAGSANTLYEIIFDPAGGVINQPSGTPIVLWVNDQTVDNPAEANTTRLIAIYPRTGLIATHPIGPAGDPLQYALDGKSSGL